MPNFLKELKPSDWIKLGGVVVAGTLFYADAQSSFKAHTVQMDKRIERIERKL